MLTVIVTIALVGLIVWALTFFIPMPPKFAVAIQVIAGIFLLLYLLNFAGVHVGHLGHFR
jgi:hypothetical protein